MRKKPQYQSSHIKYILFQLTESSFRFPCSTLTADLPTFVSVVIYIRSCNRERIVIYGLTNIVSNLPLFLDHASQVLLDVMEVHDISLKDKRSVHTKTY